MGQLVEELERRDFQRVKRRLPCSLLIGGRCHSATVRDLSANGFFVETDADLRLGIGVIVTIKPCFVICSISPKRKILPKNQKKSKFLSSSQ